MRKLLLTCMLALSYGAFAQVGPPQSANPNTNNGYGFAQSSGAYVPLTAGKTVWQSGVTLATNGVSGSINLPSPFKFNGKSYSVIYISNNGFITFGSAPVATAYTGLSTNSAVPNLAEGAVAGFANNLINANTTTSEIAYETINGKFIVQFTDLKNTSGSATQLLNFQIQLDITNNAVQIVYGNCVSGTATTTGEVGLRGADGRGDVNNRLGTDWTATTSGTANSSNCTLGITNGTTVPANGLTFTYTPGAWIAAPTTYATLPFTENFSSWANGNSTGDLPNITYWRTWPSRGNGSWRQNDLATANLGYTGTSGWYENTESNATVIAAPAVAPTARFHSYYATAGQVGNMDLYVDLSSGGSGVRVLSFDYRNASGTDKLEVLYSTDGGVTFTSAGSLTTNSAWTKPSYVINSTAANAILRLSATADYGSDDIFVDNLNIIVTTTPPACTTATAPLNNATGVSITPTITWNVSAGVSSYKINLGTTAGGTDVMNGVDVGNVTSYTMAAASQLLYGKTYYLTVLPTNANGSSTGCVETSFTTKNIGCPTVTAPALSAINVSLTPNITWTAVTDATGYRLSVGTTAGGTNILNNSDLGNVTSYTFGTPLNNSTTYYYTVNAYTSTSNSASCTERSFTTVCLATNAPYTENFDTTIVGSTSNTNAPTCWSYIETTSSAGYGYVSSTAPASTPNCYYLFNSTATTGNIMLVSPQTTNLSDGTRRVKFSAKAGGAGYTLQIGTLSDISNPASFVIIGTAVTLTTGWAEYFVNIPAGTAQNLAFRHGLGGSSRSIYIDNVSVELVPSCVEPTGMSTSAITYKAATITWTASSSTPTGNYEIYVGASNVTPASTATPIYTNVTSPYTLTPLNPSTTYYVYLRSNCGATVSPWIAVPSFTTSTFCPTVTAPVAGATNTPLLPTITWNAVTGATGYRISMGTTSGGTDVMNNVDVGNVQTYTLPTPLNNSTTYFYTVNAYDSQVISQSCTVRNFITVCSVFVPTSYTNNFNTVPGACWSNTDLGGSPATGSTSTGTALWVGDGFLNSGSTGAIGCNIYDGFGSRRIGWLKSPVFNLSSGGYRVKFDYGLTAFNVASSGVLGSDDVVQFVVSQDGGATWTVLQTWNAANSPSNTSTAYSLDLTSYTSANTRFAFFSDNGPIADTNDVDFFVDNFVVEAIPLLGTVEAINKDNIKIYPNPFADVLNISDVKNVKSISIVDIAGRVVKTIEKPSSSLQLRELNSGMYMVILNMNDGSRQTIKAIKK